jgi:hypothetical protein
MQAEARGEGSKLDDSRNSMGLFQYSILPFKTFIPKNLALKDCCKLKGEGEDQK